MDAAYINSRAASLLLRCFLIANLQKSNFSAAETKTNQTNQPLTWLVWTKTMLFKIVLVVTSELSALDGGGGRGAVFSFNFSQP